ncbi:hypothetical protein Vafri_6477 [Volvox africanus]|uniref:non-specific serine/threonine protein kinase n=1 Tax=Volvox africanus TaxID=51714 RepID=A0A8J4EWT6_9CHLO|nr:hypothetical protein Vafri_6477 [Volvox africanus]
MVTAVTGAQPPIFGVSASYGSLLTLGAAPMASGRKRTKGDVCEALIGRLQERGDVAVDADLLIGVRKHFESLPTRYALDVNVDGLDVLSHKRLLDEARADPTTVSFAVRPVEILVQRAESSWAHELPRANSRRQGLCRPAFGSSPNLQALALEVGDKAEGQEAEPATIGSNRPAEDHSVFYEITIASVDQPKLLSRLSEALGDLNLNIREAHAFNTNDGFSLDVFVVDHLQGQPGQSLEELLGQRLLQMPPPPQKGGAPPTPTPAVPAPGSSAMQLPVEQAPSFSQAAGPSPESPLTDDWEIDITQLHIEAKVASGAFSNLYKGTYCGQEVAVKILKDVTNNSTQYQEFLQEVSIMRKVRHKNVVQFYGACTREPNLCIVFEYMSGGSVYDYIRREGPLKLTALLKLATDVARGMDYLHQRKIIHRDLKAANLLMDENAIVKIADFGVARVISTSGEMTAETGTYRWMAPEVIEHKPYDEKADVFSFGIVLWELLTCKVPYMDMTPLQAAVGVVQKGLRPAIPPNCPLPLAELMGMCWTGDPAQRPSFRDLTPRLHSLYFMSLDDEKKQETKPAAAKQGLLSKLRGK